MSVADILSKIQEKKVKLGDKSIIFSESNFFSKTELRKKLLMSKEQAMKQKDI